MRNPGDDNPSIEFEDLTLDQIRMISAADLANAEGINQQAGAVEKLNTFLETAIRNIGDCWQKVNQPSLVTVTGELMTARELGELEGGMMLSSPDRAKVFQGESARVAITQLDELGLSSKTGAYSIEDQPEKLRQLSTQVQQADRDMNALFEERKEYLDLIASDPANPKLLTVRGVTPGMTPELVAHAVNVEYDRKARTTMGTHVNGYYEQARTMQSPPAYDGPRTEAPAPRRMRGGGDLGGRDGGGSTYGPGGYNSPGPSLTSTSDVGGRPSGYDVPDTGSSRTPTSSYAPELTSTAGPVTTGPHYTAAAPPAGPPNTTVFGPVSSGGYHIPNQTVTRPVYGTRNTPNYGTPRQALRPNTSGLTRPVIGERPGKAVNAFGRPQQPVVRAGQPNPPAGRAGTGSALNRPGAPGSARTNSTSPLGRRGGTAEPRTPQPRSLSRDGRVTTAPRTERPGVRSLKARGHTADGRVVRGRPAKTAAPRVLRAEFGRDPRISHGGNDDRDANALRNSRPLSSTAPAETTTVDTDAVPTEQPDRELAASDWFEATAVVPPVIRGARIAAESAEYDPGHYVTRHNIGKRL